MSVFVVNRLSFSVPVDDLVGPVRERFPSAFDSCEGFVRFAFVKTGDTEAVVLIEWDTPEHAAAGAERIGPTVFHEVVAPHLVDQDRRVGPELAGHRAGEG